MEKKKLLVLLSVFLTTLILILAGCIDQDSAQAGTSAENTSDQIGTLVENPSDGSKHVDVVNLSGESLPQYLGNCIQPY